MMIFVQEAEVLLLEGEGVVALLEEEISRGEERVDQELQGESETVRLGTDERALPQDEEEKVGQPGTDAKVGLQEKDEEEDQEEIRGRDGVEGGAGDLPKDLKVARLLAIVEVQGEADDLVEDGVVRGTAARLLIAASQTLVPVAVAVLAEGAGE